MGKIGILIQTLTSVQHAYDLLLYGNRLTRENHNPNTTPSRAILSHQNLIFWFSICPGGSHPISRTCDGTVLTQGHIFFNWTHKRLEKQHFTSSLLTVIVPDITLVIKSLNDRFWEACIVFKHTIVFSLDGLLSAKITPQFNWAVSLISNQKCKLGCFGRRPQIWGKREATV